MKPMLLVLVATVLAAPALANAQYMDLGGGGYTGHRSCEATGLCESGSGRRSHRDFAGRSFRPHKSRRSSHSYESRSAFDSDLKMPSSASEDTFGGDSGDNSSDE